MLQHHLRGRYYFMGVGRGLARRNFDAMNVNIDESRERFYEILDIVTLALTQEMFSFEGQFYAYKNASLRPRPLDERVITDAWGAWTSEQTLRDGGARPAAADDAEQDARVVQRGHDPLRRDPRRARVRAGTPADPPGAALRLRGRGQRGGDHPAVHLGVRRLRPPDVRARHRELRARPGRTRSTGRRARTSGAARRSRRSRRSPPSSCATASSARRRSAPSASPRTGRRSTRRSSSSSTASARCRRTSPSAACASSPRRSCRGSTTSASGPRTTPGRRRSSRSRPKPGPLPVTRSGSGRRPRRGRTWP